MPLPPLEEILTGLRVVSIRLNTRFRGITQRELALIEGPSGWGEFGAFLEYDTVESARWLASAIETAWDGWPTPVRREIPINATVPAVSAPDVPRVLSRYDGCLTAKIKVAEAGQDLGQDLDRVAAVRAAMGSAARLRVDANGGWSVSDAVDAIAALQAYDLEYVEQPCQTVEELRDVRMALARNGIDVRIAADESIRKADDPLRVVALGAADVAVVKAAPLGGVGAALRIAQECGLPIVVSSALDSSVGIAAGLALAGALPELPFACGLGTVELFDGDVITNSLVPHHGSITLSKPAAEPELLDRWAADAERTAWWTARVRACYAELAASMTRR